MAENPVQEFLSLKTKAAADRSADDLELWYRWNDNGQKPEHLRPLMQKYAPLINRKVREWKAPAVAPEAFRMELNKHFIQAAQSFDPERGVAFNTHLQNRLQKAKRFNAKYQNVGYIPEGQAKNIGPLLQAQNELTETLGRPPTHAEIGEHINLSPAKVTSLMQALRKDSPASEFETDPAAFSTSREADVVRLIRRTPSDYLTPDETRVFNHIFGNGVKKITDTTGLASHLGLSQPRVSQLKTSVANKIKKNM